jgi:hypothetical protein
MATQLLIPPKFRAFDDNGDPLSGGLLYSYEAGSATPLATYTTRAGNISNANPVVLDPNGEANVWMAPGVDYKFELRDSGGVVQWTVDNVPSPEDDQTVDVGMVPGGRLSLSTGTAITTTDVTTATTVYYVPHVHNKVPLYDGTTWAVYDIASQLSQTTSDSDTSPTEVADNSNYDCFIWNDNGTLRVSRGPGWDSDTSRGTGAGTTELEIVDGRYVNKNPISNGPDSQLGLYVGTIRTEASGYLEDSIANRFVWNLHHQVDRPMHVVDATNSWAYRTTSWRQANGSTANQVNFVVGIEGQPVTATVQAAVTVRDGSGAASVEATVGVALDSRTAVAVGALTGTALLYASSALTSADVTGASLTGSLFTIPGIGLHYLAWLELGGGTGSGTTVTTWYGDNGTSNRRSGLNAITKG